jgi:hypothetical protein
MGIEPTTACLEGALLAHLRLSYGNVPSLHPECGQAGCCLNPHLRCPMIPYLPARRLLILRLCCSIHRALVRGANPPSKSNRIASVTQSDS